MTLHSYFTETRIGGVISTGLRWKGRKGRIVGVALEVRRLMCVAQPLNDTFFRW